MPMRICDAVCPHCNEAFTSADDYRLISNEAYHEECFYRLLSGGLNHLKHLCQCYGGAEPPDPPDMTKREAAIAAYEYWLVLQQSR